MRSIGWLVATLTLAAAPGAAQQARPHGAGPLGRIVAGALNPDSREKATMAFGAEAGVALGPRATLLGRVLRQSQNRNSGADLSHDARDLFSLLMEFSSGPAAMRERQYLLRVGAGVMRRPHLPAAAVATLGLGIRYPIYEGVTLVGSLEDDLADLSAGSYEYSYYDPLLLTTIHTTVISKQKLQNNFGVLLAVEWRP